MNNLYKKRFPKRNLHETCIDVLRLPDSHWKQFRKVADQFSGGAIHHPEVKRPRHKVKPSSYRTIASLQDKSTLAYLMNLERISHSDHSKEFHEGGGLFDATTSIFRGLWNTIGLGPEFDRWFGTFDYNSDENRITSDEQDFVKMTQQSYKPINERAASIDEWVRDAALDMDRYTTWVDEDDKKVHIGVRGTKANVSDIFADFKILLSNSSGKANDLRNYIQRVRNDYEGYDIEASGHSLGGNQLIDVHSSGDAGLSRVNLFNPGVSSLVVTDNIKNISSKPNTHLYLNTGDTISNTMVSYVGNDDNVKWSAATHNPIDNHSLSQWSDDD